MPTSSAIQQSLSLLLPSHAAKLPSQLTHLSESLLALSRQRASHLKPEEEIARAYACCEIACRRLRAPCRLPAVKAGTAPCKPAVYKKLVAFLERVLDQDVTATPTPKKQVKNTAIANTGRASLKRTASEAEMDSEAYPELGPSETPSKRARNNATSTPTKRPRNNDADTPSKTPRSAFSKAMAGRKGLNASQEKDAGLEAPSFVMPSIRKLCKTFDTPLLAPHVYTGTAVVLRLTGLWPRDETVEDEQGSQPGLATENDTGTGAGTSSSTANGSGNASQTEPTAGTSAFKPGSTSSSSSSSSFQETVTGLIIALYLMTLTRMQTAKMTASVYKTTCAKSVQELSYAPGTDGVEAWIRRINRDGYCRGQDWWGSVPESVFEFDPPTNAQDSKSAARRAHGRRAGQAHGGREDGDDEEDDEDEDEDGILSATLKRKVKTVGKARHEEEHDDDDSEDPEGVLLPGLATMMQHAVDFTSEERTDDFEAWKRAFVRKLDALDKAMPSRGGAASSGRGRVARMRSGRRVAVT